MAVMNSPFRDFKAQRSPISELDASATSEKSDLALSRIGLNERSAQTSQVVSRTQAAESFSVNHCIHSIKLIAISCVGYDKCG